MPRKGAIEDGLFEFASLEQLEVAESTVKVREAEIGSAEARGDGSVRCPVDGETIPYGTIADFRPETTGDLVGFRLPGCLKGVNTPSQWGVC